MANTRSRIALGTAGLLAHGIGWALLTQWVAERLGYQPRLGAPLVRIGQTSFYAPWSAATWWLRYRYSAPGVFHTAACVAAGLCGSLALLGPLCGRRESAEPSITFGSSRWAQNADLRAAGLFASRGVMLGRWNGRDLRHVGPEHVLAFAPTRSGKGVGLVIPTLLSWTGSVIVHDIKGENWAITAGWRSRFSNCLRFDPTDAQSSHYNPLLEVRLGDKEVADVQSLADILIDPEGVLERKSHWELASHALLVGAILHVLYAGGDKTLAAVANVLADPERSFAVTLDEMLRFNHLGDAKAVKTHPVVASAARDLLNKSEAERSGILSTALNFLNLYRDPIIAELTIRSDWRIADLQNEAAAASLYLIIPPSDISRTRALIRLVLNQIVRRLTEDLPKPDRPVRSLLLMLDEFPALGRLDFFETSLAFLAGYGVRAFLVAQSLNQVVKAYGENNSIVDNCHVRIAFACNDDRTARRISDMLGVTTQQRAMRSYGGPRLSAWLPHVTESRQETGRPLLTPGEIMQLPRDDALLFVAGCPPIRAKKLCYYGDRRFTNRCLPPPPIAYAAARSCRDDSPDGLRQASARDNEAMLASHETNSAKNTIVPVLGLEAETVAALPPLGPAHASPLLQGRLL